MFEGGGGKYLCFVIIEQYCIALLLTRNNHLKFLSEHPCEGQP